ncbi:hypothetical protein C1I89_14605 [Achromobacter pulmonis]|uniref:ABC-type transport auxiliary lipoprotein component domain-containing protein n=1 Tax=Achromobacter pulmonis TaxID=1389932 RepID=A0A2N8KJQ8_9BURK|nr:PqiC family protein [Achromobacter pulmonis]PND33686.1 hypothetical protein C1I89_14605 [Achromobacter pulmonis]
MRVEGIFQGRPIRYHTLLSPAPEATASAEPAPFFIDVLPVGIPAQLDQPQWVVRRGSTDIFVLDDERWPGSLADEFRSALSTELTHRLATQDIAGLAVPAGKPALRVKLQVRRFDGWPGERAQLDADWSLGFADDSGNARLVCRSRLDERARGGYPELAQAQQRMVAMLAADIAMGAREWARSRRADCPEEGDITRPSPAMVTP